MAVVTNPIATGVPLGTYVGISRVPQVATPNNGDTVLVTETSSNVLLWLLTAAAIASCTIQLPSEAGSIIGQEVSIGATKAVTTVTVVGATTIFNAATTLAAGDLFALRKVAANTWAREE